MAWDRDGRPRSSATHHVGDFPPAPPRRRPRPTTSIHSTGTAELAGKTWQGLDWQGLDWQGLDCQKQRGRARASVPVWDGEGRCSS